MSLKRFYYNKDIKCCHTCMFIDEYALNVNDEGEVPHGYDGTAVCCAYNDKEPRDSENRLFISPCWKACHKYKKCTERQANYLDVFDMKTQTIVENPNDISKIN